MALIRTQVGIIGAGPAGLLLSQLLHQQGIDSIILENRSRQRVESRLRAGLLEQNTVDLLKEAGADFRLKKEGLVHEGVVLSYNGKRHRIALSELTSGACVTIYGQQEVVKDLIKTRLEAGEILLFEAEATSIAELDTSHPTIHYIYEGEEHTLSCDFVAGCDGFHGISRHAIPDGILNVYDKTYPYCWLGILAQVPPSTDELIYAFHERGFALHSMRSSEISRLYVQCGVEDTLEDWPDARIWEELQIRLGTPGWTLQEGPILEKSITPMRNFVTEPMQYNRLFLAGDAAHIVPPTGGKGMNMAVADSQNLFNALLAWYREGNTSLLDSYSTACTNRVWRVQDFSNYMTDLLHLSPTKDAFEQHLQQSRFDLLTTSEAASRVIAENYVGIASKRASEAIH